MLLSFIFALCVSFLVVLRASSLRERRWVIALAAGLLFSLAISFVSVWIVWSPYITNWTVHSGGNYEGIFPFSKLSYPVYITVYHTPFKEQTAEDWGMTGNVSFSVFAWNSKIIQVNGVYAYGGVFGVTPLHYTLDFAPFNDKMSFFGFLFILFMLLNALGATVGNVLAYVFLKARQRIA